MALQAGQMAGDYEVLGVLGKGGMGRVYRVRNVISDRIEAMKVLLEDIDSEPGVSDRFIVEIRTLARLDHPGIAKFYTAFHLRNQLLMVMEYVEGVDLADRACEAAIPVPEVIGYIKQVLAALSYAHKRGVVHRDIKPSNIMVSPQGEVKLMDFGIAKSNTEPRLTRTGATMGSLHYMSPEQVRGDTVDARSDLYSLGIVLYELSAGRCPFEGASTYAILNAQLNTPPRPPIELNRSLPSQLNEIILTALNKDPGNRFQDALAFFRALESVGAEHQPGKTRFVADPEAHVIPPPAAPPSRPPQLYAPDSTPIAPSKPAAVQPAAPLVIPVEFAKKPAEPPSQGPRRSWLPLAAIACLCVLAALLIASTLFKRRPVPGPRHHPERVAENNPPPLVPSSPPPSSTLPELSPSNFPAPAPEKQTDNGSNQPAPNPSPATPRTPKKPTEPQLPTQPEPAPPEQHFSRPGVTFGGDRDVVAPGQSIVLSWSVTDATRVQILPGFPVLAPAGTITVSPTENTQYTLLAEGPGGTATRQFSVRVQDLSRTTHAGLSIVSFRADRQSILLGTSASLHWDVQGAARVTIAGFGVVGFSGTLSVKPARTTRYVLVASAADGSSIAQTVTVSVSAQQ
jgi:eukaryotic-like serine/threonine-protein kinase